MNRIKRQAGKLFLIGLLFILPGCGYESLVRDENPIPLSGDVIVIGDSFAGLVSALEAARHGAAVLVFYEAPGPDSWIWNEGVLAAGQAGDEEIEERNNDTLLQAALKEAGGAAGDRSHYELIACRSGADIDWLARETGVGFAWESGFRYLPDNISPTCAYERLIDAAQLEGVRFFDDVSGLELIFKEGESESESVVGVQFETSPGISRSAYAPVVILADGGYLGSQDLLDSLAPSITPASWRSGQTGPAMLAAVNAGVDLVDEALFTYVPAFDREGAWVRASWPDATLLIIEDRLIPLDGKADQDLAAELLETADHTGLLLIAERQLPRDYSLDWPQFSGIDEFMVTHRLELPLLRRWYARPYGEFFGVQVKVVAEYCLGGIAVNTDGIVLKGGKPVAGLYAIGETAGGLFGRDLLPGAALTGDVVWGRAAGKTVTEYACR